MKVDSLDEFLREMQHITASCGTSFKKSSPVFSKEAKFKENKSAPEDTDHQKKKDSFCTYCRGKNHSKENCFKLKRKKHVPESTHSTSSSLKPAVAAVGESEEKTSETIA
ncbi:adenylyl cyclase-associated protein 2, partial [Lasius niger]